MANTTPFAPAGYGVLDLMAHWNFAPGATFNVGVFNLADKRYIEWSSITPSLITDRALSDRFSSPGRTFTIGTQPSVRGCAPSGSMIVAGESIGVALNPNRENLPSSETYAGRILCDFGRFGTDSRP